MVLKIGHTGPDVAHVQELLGLPADGVFGPKTFSAVRAFQEDAGLKADGIVGPKTWEELEALDDDVQEDEAPDRRILVGTVDFAFPRSLRSRADLYRLLGNPGEEQADEAWANDNIVYCHPKGHKPPLPGVPSKWWVAIHKEVEPYLREALIRAQATSDYRIERLGGYVWRHQRHDASRPLSDHSWGVAVDINPRDNRMIKKPGEPWSAEWNRAYPRGMPREFVEAFKSVGWRWGGDWRGMVDPMHLSLAGTG